MNLLQLFLLLLLRPLLLNVNAQVDNQQVTPAVANKWAENILDTIFTARHQHILNNLNAPATKDAIDAMRDNEINKLAKDDPKAAILTKLTSEDFLEKLKEGIGGPTTKDFHTIAVMVIEDNIYVAGNVKSLNLPSDPTKPELFTQMAMGKEIIYPNDHFGIQDTDALAIKQSIQNLEIKYFFEGKEPQVHVVRPEGGGEYEAKQIAEKKDEWDRIASKATANHKLALSALPLALENSLKEVPKLKENTELFKSKLASSVQSAETKFKNKLNSMKKQFDTDNLGPFMDYTMKKWLAHVYHAEMQLKATKQGINDKTGKVVLGVSKSLCEKCATAVIDDFDFEQHTKPGQAKENVIRWETDIPGPRVEPLEYLISAVGPQQQTLESIDASECSRRKRSIGSPCARINSKSFVKEYADGDDNTRMRLAEATRSKDGIEIDGNADDAKKLKKLVQLEDVKDLHKSHLATKLKGNVEELWGNLELQVGKVKTKLSQTKVARKIYTLATSKGFSKTSSSISKASAPIGIFLLGKSVINGIIHKDYQSLGIIGGMIGIQAVGYGAQLTNKLATVGSKFAKSSKFIGKAVGPIGVVADIGLSIYSLVNSVNRLNNAADVYARNDAIADITQNSIDIAITTTVVVATAIFPPAGLVIAAVGIVVNLVSQLATSLFKTKNEIDRINSQMPLLEFEKTEQFVSRFFDWFGTRQDDYIDHLVTEKKLNDKAVEYNLQFLRDNPDLSGIAFPARSISYSGSCRALRRTCGLKNLGGCTWNFEPDIVLATGCDKGKLCGAHSCTDYWISTGTLTYDDYRCVCDQDPKVDEGYPRLNNHVDFRKVESVYLERAVPAAVNGANFKCRPGNEKYQGFRISQEKPISDYLCEGTIALFQPNGGGTRFYFDLQEGKDTVYLNKQSKENNTFIVQNGVKNYHGAQGIDSFILHPSCTDVKGQINGGDKGQANSVTLSDSLLPDQTFYFENNYLRDDFGMVNLSTNNINEITGRIRQKERVSPSCTTHTLRLRGGKNAKLPDQIEIPQLDCHHDKVISIVAEGSTKVIAKKEPTVPIQIIALTGPETNFMCDVSVLKRLDVTIIIEHRSFDLSNVNVRSSAALVSMGWQASNGQGQYQINIDTSSNPEIENVKLLFREGGSGRSSYSFVNFNGPKILQIVHTLTHDHGGDSVRKGAADVTNVFHLVGGNWQIFCGKMGDQIVLSDDVTQSEIFCEKGHNQNILTFTEESVANKRPPLDFMKGVIGNNIKISGITAFEGRENISEKVTCGCDTQYVATRGGNDHVIVPNRRHCSEPKPLTVIAEGDFNLTDEGTREKQNADSRVAVLLTKERQELDFIATTSENSSLSFDIVLTNDLYLKPNTVRLTSGNWISIGFEGRRRDKMVFHIYNITKNGSPSLSGPHISLYSTNGEHNGNLIIQKSGIVQLIHYLGDRCGPYKGVEGLENFYKLTGNCWSAEGATGSANTFVMQMEDAASLKETSLNGGNNSENTLFVEELGDGTQRVYFNFHSKWFGHSYGLGGKLDRIQNFYGRVGQPDTISMSCNSFPKLVDGRGGNAAEEDTIIITQGEQDNFCETTVLVGKNTEVQNTARRGHFVYNVSIESGLDCVKCLPTKENQHIIQYRFLPMGLVDGATYDSGSNLLVLLFSFNDTLKFRAIRQEGKLNPAIRFVDSEWAVTCELTTKQDEPNREKLQALWIINGSPSTGYIRGIKVPENIFIVNVNGSSPNLGLIGGSDPATQNVFWLVSHSDPIKLLSGTENSTNSLFLLESYYQHLHLVIDLDDENGSIYSPNGPVVESLLHIHKVFGRPALNDTVIPGCNTRQISQAGVIIIQPGPCPWFYLDIFLNSRTSVELVLSQNDYENEINDFQLSSTTEPVGEFRYHFDLPRSFTPSIRRSIENQQIFLSDHIYQFPFTLGDMRSLAFYEWNDTLAYSIGNQSYFHQMLSPLGETDEFYPQPKFFTRDTCELRIGRIGDITVICNPEEDFFENPDSIANTALRLGITIFYRTEEFILQAGNNRGDERNLLTTSANLTNLFYGGDGVDTIYQITFLSRDVIIWRRLTNHSSETHQKHTIDLTEILVPLRLREGNKYVPKVERVDEDLVISLPESRY